VLHKQRFTSMTLVNPIIGSFSHDNLDQADGAGVLSNTMQILYETVIYKSGIINKNNVPGFATIHYDNSPSPLTVLGGGTNSIFGPGGVVDGIGSVIKMCSQGTYWVPYWRHPTHTTTLKNQEERCQGRTERHSKRRYPRDRETGRHYHKPCGGISPWGRQWRLATVMASAKGTSDKKQTNTQ
jgi:hypothetical protein